jgi:hypothetical protein
MFAWAFLWIRASRETKKRALQGGARESTSTASEIIRAGLLYKKRVPRANNSAPCLPLEPTWD